MKVLLIIFAIVVGIIQLYKRYIIGNMEALIKFKAKGGSVLLGILIITEYILGAIITIKLILKLIGE